MICGMLPGTCNLQFHITRRNGLVSAICSCFYDTTIVSCEGYVEGTYPTPTLFTGVEHFYLGQEMRRVLG